MIRLSNANTDLLSLITAQNGAKVVVSYSDGDATSYDGGTQTTSVTSATTTTIASTPASGKVRDVDQINVYNTFAGSHAVTVQLSSGGVLFPLVAVTLLQGESLAYTHGGGWCALDANGNRKEATSSTFATLTVTGAAAFGGAITYGGVTLSNSVTGTGSMVLSASPTLTGTLTGAAANFSGAVGIATSGANALTISGAGTNGQYATIGNTGNTLIAGLQSSAGSGPILGATNAYAAVIGSQSARDLVLITNNAARVTFDSTGGTTFNGFVAVPSTSPIYLDNGSDTYFQEVSANVARIIAGGGELMRWTSATGVTKVTGDIEVPSGATYAGLAASDVVQGQTRLTVKGTGTNSTTEYPAWIWNPGTAGDSIFLAFATETTVTLRGAIDYNRAGGLVRYNTTSDYRAGKLNPEPLTGSGAFIDALQPRSWTWEHSGERGAGFIAHEFQAVAPQSVSGAKDEMQTIIPSEAEQIAQGHTDVESLIKSFKRVPKLQSFFPGSPETIANMVAELQDLRRRVATLEHTQ